MSGTTEIFPSPETEIVFEKSLLPMVLLTFSSLILLTRRKTASNTKTATTDLLTSLWFRNSFIIN
jgi:hypothetical protein